MAVLHLALQTAGSAILTVMVLVGLAPTKLGEKFLNYYLERKLAAIEHGYERSTEELRAALNRVSRVHKRQVKVLTKLVRHFRQISNYLQAMTRSLRFEGEISADEYCRMCDDIVGSVHKTLADGRLLIPSLLADDCDRFLTAAYRARTLHAYAWRTDIVDGRQRAEFWDKAKEAAYVEVPGILQRIEDAARQIVHGAPPPTISLTTGEKRNTAAETEPLSAALDSGAGRP
jgi:hypothetical protein